MSLFDPVRTQKKAQIDRALVPATSGRPDVAAPLHAARVSHRSSFGSRRVPVLCVVYDGCEFVEIGSRARARKGLLGYASVEAVDWSC
jgi:hypothetical protein